MSHRQDKKRTAAPERREEMVRIGAPSKEDDGWRVAFRLSTERGRRRNLGGSNAGRR